MKSGAIARRIVFAAAVSAAVVGAVAIFRLTEQVPGATSHLSSRAQSIMTDPAGNLVLGGTKTSVAANLVLALPEGLRGLAVRALEFASIRKWAHTVQFFALGGVVCAALAAWWGRPRSLAARSAIALAVCASCSLFDQTHKLFVPGREFDAGDLLFDAAGYLAAWLLVFGAAALVGRFRSMSAARRAGSKTISAHAA